MTDRKRVYDTMRKYVALSVSADSRTTAIPLDLAGDILDLLKEPEPRVVKENEIEEYVGKVIWFEFKNLVNISPVEIIGVTNGTMWLNKLPDEWYLKTLETGDARAWTAKPSEKQRREMKWE